MYDMIYKSILAAMALPPSILILSSIIITIVVVFVPLFFQRKIYMKSEYFEETKTHFWKMRRDLGLYGEYLISKQLAKLEGNKRFLFNCYLPKKDGTTSEVDVILLHSSGIYVFESKNYSGWIFGTETQSMWTQTFKNGHKEKFYNPIMQNSTHIKWLLNILPDIDRSIVNSVIVFSERCELKKITLTTDNHIVLKRNSLLRTFVGKTDVEMLSYNTIESIYQKLYPFTQVSEAVKTAHINNVTRSTNNE